jgi:hypothetical protein
MNGINTHVAELWRLAMYQTVVVDMRKIQKKKK